MKKIKEKVKFTDLKFEPLAMGGIQARIHFTNGYGASVIKHSFSYGGTAGFYELAVLDGESLCYDTPITDDVIGWLDEEEVENLLNDIRSLPVNEKV